jgi:hypothetical protein
MQCSVYLAGKIMNDVKQEKTKNKLTALEALFLHKLEADKPTEEIRDVFWDAYVEQLQKELKEEFKI